MARITLTLLGIVFFLSGCGVKYNIQGEYYMQQGDFGGGRQAFEKVLKKDPTNPTALHFYGRFLLAQNRAKAALPYLEKAVAGNPGDSSYHFWLGVAYGENGARGKERESYQEALRLDKQNVQALTYLGNSFLQGGELEKGLTSYQRALEIWPENSQALYNRALILRKLNRESEERQAWLLYLQSFPDGVFAQLATDRLNSLEDFSYRNYQLGLRTLTLTEIGFLPLSATLSAAALPSLDLLGGTVAAMEKGTLQIVVYQQNNLQLAKMRAMSIRDYLESQFPKLQVPSRIRISWFDVPEEITVLDKKLVRKESVQFFLSDIGKSKQGAGKEGVAKEEAKTISQKKTRMK
ncbi:MAG: tetratricopeptide repeat protein [Desulforhopalus sp.]|nr:tetratricopeptide repeat protein [Desulforhopalus sp.]